MRCCHLSACCLQPAYQSRENLGLLARILDREVLGNVTHLGVHCGSVSSRVCWAPLIDGSQGVRMWQSRWTRSDPLVMQAARPFVVKPTGRSPRFRLGECAVTSTSLARGNES